MQSEKDIISQTEIVIHEIYNLVINEFPSHNISLLSGNSGVILFLINYYKQYGYPTTADEVQKNIHETISAISNLENYSYDLASGLIGCLWTLNYAQKEDFIELPDDFLSDDLKKNIDDFFLSEAFVNNFDLFYGGIGWTLFYFQNKDIHGKFLKDFLEMIKNKSITQNNTIFWEDSIIDKKDKKQIINLGLAHGIPSIISILSKYYKNNINTEDVEDLIRKSIKYILNLKSNYSNDSLFPDLILDGVPNNGSRLAWCYGDLGIASAIWQAGCTLNDDKLKQEAEYIALHTSSRLSLPENGILDAGFCHGTVGLAHIYNRFFRETKNNKFKELRMFWLAKTHELRVFSDGLAQFKSWGGPEKKYQNEYGLLEGVSGIGLVMLGILSESEDSLDWDEWLLLN